jgi:hypothetical protein
LFRQQLPKLWILQRVAMRDHHDLIGAFRRLGCDKGGQGVARMRRRLQRFQVLDQSTAGQQVHRMHLAAARAPSQHAGVPMMAGGQSQARRRRQNPRHAPKPDAGIEQQAQGARRLLLGRFAPEKESFVESDPNRQGQVVVSQLAQQQPIQRAAIGQIRHAADGQLFPFAQVSWQSDRGHEPARRSGHGAPGRVAA